MSQKMENQDRHGEHTSHCDRKKNKTRQANEGRDGRRKKKQNIWVTQRRNRKQKQLAFKYQKEDIRSSRKTDN